MLKMNSVNKIHRLRVLCGGVGSNQWYSHQFNAIKNCEILLSVEGFEKALSDPLKSSLWIRIANVLLPLIDKSEKFRITFRKLLKLILDNKAIEGRDEFLLNIWKSAVSSKIALQIPDLEEFIKKEPKYVEIKIIDVVEEVLNKDNNKLDEISDIWVRNDGSILLGWCLESTVIFCMIISIMNEILLRFSGKKFIQILSLIKCFIHNLLTKCQTDGKNFVKLYPLQHRHLVYLLKCGPASRESFCNDEEITWIQLLPIIQNELDDRPEIIITLLSHCFGLYGE